MKLFNFLFVCALAVASFSSCGSSCDEADFNADVQAATDKITTATATFSADPLAEGACEAYKAAYQTYIDELRDLEDCATELNSAGFGDTIIQAQNSLDALSC